MIGDGGVAATLQRLALGMRRATEEFTIMAMHAQAILPHSLLTQFPADSGWRVMSSEQAVLPSPSDHFRRYTAITKYAAQLDQPALSIFGRSADDGTGASRFWARTGPIGRNEPLPAFLRFALCHHKIFRSFLVCLFWALHSDWEGDIAEIRVFRGDGRHRRLGSL